MVEFWGEPISRYTADQAVADGQLVDIRKWGIKFHGRLIQYVTGVLWAEMKPFMLYDPDTEKAEFVKQWKSTLRTKLRMAVDFADGDEPRGTLFTLPGGEQGLWLVENETGGWTLMFPSDY
jgi:hypothetical protein